MPTTGQIIIFDRVPTGSYCSTGIAYRVTAPKSAKGDYNFRRVDDTSGTYDRVWAVKAAKWHVA